MSNDDMALIFDQINNLSKPTKDDKDTKTEDSKEGISEVLEEVADEIKRILGENHLTQDELCKLTGMSQSNISKILNGKIIPRIETLQKMAEATNTKLIISFEKKEGDEE